MKSLAERHADRAQRKADNAAESQDASNYAGGLGNAANLIMAAQEAFGNLTPDQREELQSSMTGGDVGDGFRSIAEEGNDAPGLALAGIGTVDTRVTPLRTAFDAVTNASGAGELPAPSFDPAKGNLNGAAVDAAGTPANAGGWGSPPPAGEQAGNGAGAGADGYGALTLAELKAEADKRDVAYDAKVKNTQEGRDTMVALLRAADDKAKAGGEGQGGDNS